MKWRHDDPTHATAGFCAGLRDKSVICARHRHVQSRVVRKVNQKQSRKYNLLIDAEFVHVLEPARNIRHLPVSEVNVAAGGFEFRRGRSDQTKTAFAVRLGKDIAVDKPKSVSRPVERVFRSFKQHGPAMIHVLIHHRPHRFAFRNMRVRINYAGHWNSSFVCFVLASYSKIIPASGRVD